jgi:hypothetical protein
LRELKHQEAKYIFEDVANFFAWRWGDSKYFIIDVKEETLT